MFNTHKSILTLILFSEKGRIGVTSGVRLHCVKFLEKTRLILIFIHHNLRESLKKKEPISRKIIFKCLDHPKESIKKVTQRKIKGSLYLNQFEEL